MNYVKDIRWITRPPEEWTKCILSCKRLLVCNIGILQGCWLRWGCTTVCVYKFPRCWFPKAAFADFSSKSILCNPKLMRRWPWEVVFASFDFNGTRRPEHYSSNKTYTMIAGLQCLAINSCFWNIFIPKKALIPTTHQPSLLINTFQL